MQDFIRDVAPELAGHLRAKGDLLEGYFQGYTLHSVFQPVYSFAHHSPVGYEALMRATSSDGQSISPLELFSRVTEQHELMKLEEITRLMHVNNFFSHNTKNAWLFLNVNPELMNESSNWMQSFFNMLEVNGIPAWRIVIEFVESSVKDFGNLIRTTATLKRNGCLVAIDDFGAGFSNFNRVWDMQPDIVKLDKSMINRLKQDNSLFRPFISLVELLHESGALVVIEGIEDETDARNAHNLDVDLHQGYFFGHPEREVDAVKSNPYMQLVEEAAINDSIALSSDDLSSDIITLFREAAGGVHPETPLEETCHSLLHYPYITRCYLLDSQGRQVGGHAYGRYAYRGSDRRFNVLADVEAANWSRRKYFRRALKEPMKIHVTKPYFSLFGAHMCKTASIAVSDGQQTYVLCCDIGM